MPGIGKTASVVEIVSSLEKSEKVPFSFITLNGLKVQKPNMIYNQLFMSIFGESLSSEAACKALGRIEIIRSFLFHWSDTGCRQEHQSKQEANQRHQNSAIG